MMAAGADIRFSCRCGKLSGALSGVRASEGTHVVCHCDYCRRANAAFGIPGTREAGVDLWQTTPDRIRIETGAEAMALMRLSSRGVFRWYAACCGTPMFNTMAGPRLPFVGVLVDRLDDPAPLGPVVAQGFVEGPDGKSRHVHGGRVVWRFLRRTARARLNGSWRKTPFFTMPDGTPVAPPGPPPDRA